MENDLKEKAAQILKMPDNSVLLIMGGMTKHIAKEIVSVPKKRTRYKLDHFDKYEY